MGKTAKKIRPQIFLNALLSIALCLPSPYIFAQAAFALTPDTTQTAAHSHAALVQDGGSGSVVLCLPQSFATEVACELGLSANDNNSGETDAHTSLDTDLSNTSSALSWDILMDASGASVSEAAEGKTVNTQSDDTYLLVCVSSTTSSTNALLTWANSCSYITSAEEDAIISTADIPNNSDAEGDINALTGASYSEPTAASKVGDVTTNDDNTATSPSANLAASSLDDYSEYLWYLNNTGIFAEGASGFDIDTTSAQESGLTPATSDQVVAVIDSGVDVNNPAISANIITNLTSYPTLASVEGIHDQYYSSMCHQESYDPLVASDHGTHVAGIVVETSKLGDASAKGATILPVMAGDDKSGFSTSSMIRAYEFVTLAVDAGINVVAANASIGSNVYEPLATRIALAQMISRGVSYATTSGNDFENIDNVAYSASSVGLAGSLIVGASDPDGSVAVYSNTGQRNVDIVAPGTNILSTTITDESRTYFLGPIAYYNSLKDIIASTNTNTSESDNTSELSDTNTNTSELATSASTDTQVLYYEGFEDNSTTTTLTNTTSMATALANEPDINGGLSFTYGTVNYDEDTYNYVIKDTGAQIETTTTTHFMGKASGVFNTTTDTQAIISTPLNGEGTNIDASKIQAIDVALRASAAMDDNDRIYFGVIDEAGTYYSTNIGSVFTNLVEGIWQLSGSRLKQLLPDGVLEDLASGNPKHTYRAVVFCTNPGVSVYVDSVAVGYGLVAYNFESGTSMASPIIAAMMAICAKNFPSDSAAKRAARIYGSATYDQTLNNICSSSGNASLKNVVSPSPVPQTLTVSGNTATIEGYFFGEGTGSVTIDGQVAPVISWTCENDKSTVVVTLPEGLTTGTYAVCVSRSGSSNAFADTNATNIGRNVFYIPIDTASAYTDYTELPSTYEAYSTAAPYDAYTVSDSTGIYLIDNGIAFEAGDNTMRAYQYNILKYSFSTGIWSMLQQNVRWAQTLGLDDDSDAIEYSLKTFTLNGQAYCAIPRYDFYSETMTGLNYTIASIDSQTGTLTPIYTTNAAVDIISSGTSVYAVYARDSETSSIVDNWISQGYAETTYYIAYELDFETQAETPVFGFSPEVDVPQELADKDYLNGASATTLIVNNYLCIAEPYEDNPSIAVADLSAASLDTPLGFSYFSAPFTTRTDTAYIATGTYLAAVSVATSDKEPLSYTMLFDPTSDEWVDTQAILSGGIPHSLSATFANDTLYVWGKEDVTLNQHNTEFFRSLSLAKWIDDDPAPNPTPDPEPAPSPSNDDASDNTSANSNSTLASTSDNTSLLTLMLFALLASCATLVCATCKKSGRHSH